jgi:hypothetical protein
MLPCNETSGGSRREFLKNAAALSAAMLSARKAQGASPVAPQAALPQIRLGKYSISRLICGSNPFNAGSHLSMFVNNAMREYYTPEQIRKTLERCVEAGINCWQSSLKNLDLYRRFSAEGLQMQFIAIDSDAANIKTFVQGGCIALAHHGEVTDKLFKTGQLDKVRDFLKRVRDAGLVTGVSTHMPAVVDAIESKGWDLDYYMTCVYERHRSQEDLEKLLGHVPLPVGEVYLADDPARMYKAVQQARRPCLAFKILAAGRLSDKKPLVEQAFRQAFSSIKPSDGVIVGIYDRYSNQPAENAAYARKYGSSSGV